MPVPGTAKDDRRLGRLLCVTRRGDGVVANLVTEFAPLGSLNDVLANIEEQDEKATSDVLLSCAMQTLDFLHLTAVLSARE